MKMAVRFLTLVVMLLAVKPLLAGENLPSANVAAKYAQAENSKGATTSNVSSDETEDPLVIQNGEEQVHINVAKLRNPHDIFVPIAFFVFLLALFLGRRFFMERTQQRKIALLEKMVEKGQPVSDAVIQQVFSDDRSQRFGRGSVARTIRRGVAFTAIGTGLLVYSLLMHHAGGKLVFGIVLLGLGIGHLVSHRFEKKENNSSDM